MRDYSVVQLERNREYSRAWEDAPEEFKEEARLAGVTGPEIEQQRHQDVLEYQVENRTASYCIDIAAALDSQVDELVERHGDKARPVIEDVIARITEVAEAKVAQDNSLKLARVVMWIMLGDKKQNITAKIHQVMHAIPRMAAVCGFPSLRASARHCGVSVQWISAGRLELCKQIGLPVPEESTKSPEAKLKYRDSATGRNHWRKKIFKPTPILKHANTNTQIPTPNHTPADSDRVVHLAEPRGGVSDEARGERPHAS